MESKRHEGADVVRKEVVICCRIFGRKLLNSNVSCLGFLHTHTHTCTHARTHTHTVRERERERERDRERERETKKQSTC